MNNWIIFHGKESLLSALSDLESPSDGRYHQGLSVKPYGRFEMQLLAIQSDKATYVREPDDLWEFEKWRLVFKLEEKGKVIANLMSENKALKDIYEEIVPVEIDAERFWTRYFYKVDILGQAEEARVRLVKRAISGEDEEDLSWDLDDEGDENDVEKDGKDSERRLKNVALEEEKVESREVSSKDSDISMISTQRSLPEVEDLRWVKMEDDIGSNEEKSLEAGQGTEEKFDLTWDIEDEDDNHS